MVENKFNISVSYERLNWTLLKDANEIRAFCKEIVKFNSIVIGEDIANKKITKSGC